MKALILSCNTGGGHNSAAKAIAEELLAHGDEAYVLDYLCLASKGVSKLVGDGYVQIVKKTPLLFGLIYKLGMFISRITRKSPVYYISGLMAKYLNRRICTDCEENASFIWTYIQIRNVHQSHHSKITRLLYQRTYGKISQ